MAKPRSATQQKRNKSPAHYRSSERTQAGSGREHLQDLSHETQTVVYQQAAPMSQSSKSSPFATWAGISLAMLLNVMSLGYVYGNIATRLHTAEQNVTDLERSTKESLNLVTDMAVVKTQLTNIVSLLDKLEKGRNSR